VQLECQRFGGTYREACLRRDFSFGFLYPEYGSMLHRRAKLYLRKTASQPPIEGHHIRQIQRSCPQHPNANNARLSAFSVTEINLTWRQAGGHGGNDLGL
jgi:hypothetical protein